MIIRIYDYNGKGKLVKIPDDCGYIEFDILNGDMVLIMETLEKLREKYNKLNKERNIIYRKIVELEQQEVTNIFTVGDCYLDTKWNDLIKIVSIKDSYIYYICLSEACISRDNSYIYDIENWEKITPHQFKDAYLAVMKDIRDPDLDYQESNWLTVYKSIMNSINS